MSAAETALPNGPAPEGAIPESPAEHRPAHRDGNVLRWLAAYTVSLIGDSVYFVALAWSAQKAAGPAEVGLVMAAGASSPWPAAARSPAPAAWTADPPYTPTTSARPCTTFTPTSASSARVSELSPPAANNFRTPPAPRPTPARSRSGGSEREERGVGTAGDFRSRSR